MINILIHHWLLQVSSGTVTLPLAAVLRLESGASNSLPKKNNKNPEPPSSFPLLLQIIERCWKIKGYGEKTFAIKGIVTTYLFPIKLIGFAPDK